jgi:hypothetical protein
MIQEINKIKTQIRWIVKQIECLKRNCGQEEVPEQDLVLGELNFKWGEATNGEIDSVFVYNTVITGRTIKDGDFNAKVYNLIVETPYWDKIKDYNPILLIDRYRTKSWKGKTKDDTNDKYRKSGYRHESQYDAQENGRINEVALTSEKTVVNFNQENYFGYFNRRPYTKGQPHQDNSNFWFDFQVGPYIYLGFRLRLIIDGKVVETGHLGFLKMQVMGNIITYKVQ